MRTLTLLHKRFSGVVTGGRSSFHTSHFTTFQYSKKFMKAKINQCVHIAMTKAKTCLFYYLCQYIVLHLSGSEELPATRLATLHALASPANGSCPI